MSTFRIVFHGVGYDVYDENGQKAGGFYVVVNVEADDLDQACSLAYEKLVCSENYTTAFGEGQHPNGVLTVSEYSELLERDPEEAEVSGFIFYPEEDTHGTDA